VPAAQATFACCDRCVNLGADRSSAVTSSVRAAAVARRRLLKAAVSRRATDSAVDNAADSRAGVLTAEADPGPGAAATASRVIARAPASSALLPETTAADFADIAQQPRTVWGIVYDVSPHVLVIGDVGREQRFILTPDAVAWRGHQVEPAALNHGDSVVIRMHPGHRDVADRIWANIGRVTGVIAERSGGTLIVDEGATRGRQVITLHPRALGRIQVRFPTLEPGYLVDIIGLRDGEELIGMIPATSQPGYPADRLPAVPLVSGRVAGAISGSATWHEPRGEPPGVLGVDYPALDPETGCAEDAAAGPREGYTRLPYLAIGSVLRVRNECTSLSCLVPVTGCASIARLFNDRCVTCGTSPRGRIADLTLASFISLGGELERGCFNVTVTIGE
jgi:hypothetical protein